ncbi:hypothetical protein, partial [Geminicoccus flavidas]|uniref:hypothetical protein n=1 Tax=Geminicoccus flavidas TaxID=2506407 RepID=UPI001F48BB38
MLDLVPLHLMNSTRARSQLPPEPCTTKAACQADGTNAEAEFTTGEAGSESSPSTAGSLLAQLSIRCRPGRMIVRPLDLHLRLSQSSARRRIGSRLVHVFAGASSVPVGSAPAQPAPGNAEPAIAAGSQLWLPHFLAFMPA